MSKIKIIIDNREKDIIQLFKVTDFKFKNNELIEIAYDNLDIGDFHIKVDEQLAIVIERKTLADLAASIKDGRYKEQKARMKAVNIPNHYKMYLIEGEVYAEDSLDKNSKFVSCNGIAISTIISSIVNTYLRDGLSIYKTKNINATAKFLAKIFEKMPEFGNNVLNNSQSISSIGQSNEQETDEYMSGLKLKKKENMTGIACYISQLAQITGVSYNIAKSISEKFNSLIDLSLAYLGLEEDKDREMLLADIKITIGKSGKERRIGKVLSKRIYENIFGKY